MTSSFWQALSLARASSYSLANVARASRASMRATVRRVQAGWYLLHSFQYPGEGYILEVSPALPSWLQC